MSFLYKLYKEKLVWDFLKTYNYKFSIKIPRIIKISINLGCGNFFLDKKKMQSIISDFNLIIPQKSFLVKCKKSIANFKIRKGNHIAIKITIRNKLMYDFLYKLINIILPRVRDFQGFSIKSFDNFGNYNFGVKDYSIFPELNYTNIIVGFNVNIIIDNNSIQDSCYLLKKINFPFKLLND